MTQEDQVVAYRARWKRGTCSIILTEWVRLHATHAAHTWRPTGKATLSTQRALQLIRDSGKAEKLLNLFDDTRHLPAETYSLRLGPTMHPTVEDALVQLREQVLISYSEAKDRMQTKADRVSALWGQEHL